MAENTSAAHAEHEHAGHTEHEHAETKRKLEEEVRMFKMLSVVLAIALVLAVAYSVYPLFGIGGKTTTTIAGGSTVGDTLAGINNPLSSTELAEINNVPNSYFESAGAALLNGSIPGETISNGTYVGVVYLMKQTQYKPLIINGKPSVIYIGAISCIYCAENRWAMALALSRFGSFGSLYQGYSALGDGDVPTLYWAREDITGTGVDFANYFTSNTINFFTGEYDSPINGSFQAPSAGYNTFIQAASNSSDKLAMEYMANFSAFRGTPTSFWGTTLVGGADAVIFGIANSTTQQNTKLAPLTYMTHSGILGQIGSMKNEFAVEEYAAADVYVAEVCIAINNTASACSLPAIKTMEGIIA